MSRVGKSPIDIPEKVTVLVQGSQIQVKGSKGEMSLSLPEGISVLVGEKEIMVTRANDEKEIRSRHGLIRNLIRNMVQGVSEGFSKTLEINGVGYRAEVKGKDLILNLGFSHLVCFAIPKGIDITINKQTEVIVGGVDRQLVGETSARIRQLRLPEPYKGKGIKYAGEIIQRKAGKSAV